MSHSIQLSFREPFINALDLGVHAGQESSPGCAEAASREFERPDDFGDAGGGGEDLLLLLFVRAERRLLGAIRNLSLTVKEKLVASRSESQPRYDGVHVIAAVAVQSGLTRNAVRRDDMRLLVAIGPEVPTWFATLHDYIRGIA